MQRRHRVRTPRRPLRRPKQNALQAEQPSFDIFVIDKFDPIFGLSSLPLTGSCCLRNKSKASSRYTSEMFWRRLVRWLVRSFVSFVHSFVRLLIVCLYVLSFRFVSFIRSFRFVRSLVRLFVMKKIKTNEAKFVRSFRSTISHHLGLMYPTSNRVY